ncbi:MAG: L-2-hydroxyglutarate oxidase [Actinobacteria bacterium]|nr:L-2-hydroxyglutarate oxidase [Actinomycetota bacterium]
MRKAHIGVVGGGIIGLATARALQRRHPGADIVVLEKEETLGAHQTARNSGVVHAGVYYTPGSLKARLSTKGMRLLRDYCARKDLPYTECGKVIVAVDDVELARLDELYRRATANGVEGVQMLEADGVRRVEPHAAGLRALWSPRTAITDFSVVARSFADDVRAGGGDVRTGTRVMSVIQRGDGVTARTTRGDVTVDRLVNCAGLYADIVAEASGDEAGPRIVPFRGDYFRLRADRRDLVRGLIYPVPDPRYPFLGVHLTLRIDGEVLVGPNAILATAREGYRIRDVDARELLRTLAWPGFHRLARTHWRTGASEVVRAMSKRAFVAAARRYVPELRGRDVVRSASGVRAQAVAASGSLVDDFRVSVRGRVVNVRNAPSPAATSSLAIAELIADEVPALA